MTKLLLLKKKMLCGVAKVQNALHNKKGEAYIEIALGVLIAVMMLVFIINIFEFLMLKQNMDYFSKELLTTATVYGKIGSEIDIRKAELERELGIKPEVTWETDYLANSSEVQLNNNISIKLTLQTKLKGFGEFSIPLTLNVKNSGLSEKFWKED